ncbi:hypothetical protein [Dyadobacter sp. CY343]|uniref:hypothetical protein n=1 Tax=Dyadobacter sp. CY343 TaxID=2907299 RepID=UPI001F2C334C|nr:hypothetical protein [Dyadobacter sp. CY343]MCE7062378.1 hypothetical protein [Dyadobacter sp. CY343]
MEFNFQQLLSDFELRELSSEADIIDHLALRTKIYKKEYSGEYVDNKYDLLPSDWKANLIGIFSNRQQIATIRVVTRRVNETIEKQLYTINEKFGIHIKPDISGCLPTEYAFQINSKNSLTDKDKSVELSRVAVSDEFRGLGLCRFAMLAAIGISILDNYKYCLYSCSVNSVKYHADLVPMMKGVTAEQNDNGYPGFKFPTSSAAVLSAFQNMSQTHMNQAIIAGVVCRYGTGVLDTSQLANVHQLSSSK